MRAPTAWMMDDKREHSAEGLSCEALRDVTTHEEQVQLGWIAALSCRHYAPSLKARGIGLLRGLYL
jgi:hypothetical protein